MKVVRFFGSMRQDTYETVNIILFGAMILITILAIIGIAESNISLIVITSIIDYAILALMLGIGLCRNIYFENFCRDMYEEEDRELHKTKVNIAKALGLVWLSSLAVWIVGLMGDYSPIYLNFGFLLTLAQAVIFGIYAIRVVND